MRLLSPFLAVIVVASLVGVVEAQSFDSDKVAEVLKKLHKKEEVRKKHPTTKEYKEPPLRLSEREELRLKSDAPPLVVAWFNQLPELREARISLLKQQVIDAREEYRQIKISNPGYITTHDSLGGSHQTPSPAGVAARARRASAQISKIQELQRKLRSAEEDYTQIIIPPLNLKVGDYGTWDYYVKILQIVDHSNARVQLGGNDVWMSGFDFSKYSDDTSVTISVPMVVTGTKTYTTILGAARTIYVIKPFNVNDYIYKVTVKRWADFHGTIVKTEVEGELPATTQPVPNGPSDKVGRDRDGRPA